MVEPAENKQRKWNQWNVNDDWRTQVEINPGSSAIPLRWWWCNHSLQLNYRPQHHLTRQTKSHNPNLPNSWHKSTLTDLSVCGGGRIRVVAAADGGSRAILMTRISDEFVSAAWARMRARQGQQTSRNLSWPITSFSLQIFLGTLACLVTLASAGPRYSSRIVETKTGSIRGVILELHTKHLEPVEVSHVTRRNCGWRRWMS